MEPKPVSRPPVDPAQTRAFGRPDGVTGSFLGADEHRDQGEYTPRDQAPDAVLADAFGRPDGSSDSLQRHPADAGALRADHDRDLLDASADPWRDPSAIPSLGVPAQPKPAPVVTNQVPMGKLGVRDVLFGGRVSWVALGAIVIVALVIGGIGGVIGNKTAEIIPAFTTSKVTLQTNGQAEEPTSRFADVASAVADSVVTIE